MPSVKLYRREDQDFPYEADAPASILAYVNTGNSDTMGGGFGVFGAGYYGDWTVTYDEFIFVHSGHFQLKINDEIFHAGPGDTLWIPKDTPLTYIADEDAWVFFAVSPASKSPSASKHIVYPDAPPQPA